MAVACLMAEAGYEVSVYLFNVNDRLSAECAINKQRVMDCKRIKDFKEVLVDFDPPKLTAETVVVDGLFGSGLTKSPLVSNRLRTSASSNTWNWVTVWVI